MITIYILVCLLITLFYLKQIKLYSNNWSKIPKFKINNNTKKDIGISIVISARNEEKNIEKCLESLNNQFYSHQKYEIIVIDDFSTDKTEEIIANFDNITIFKLKDFLDDKYKKIANKKRAINIGINNAKFDNIITCDADCEYGQNWLKTFSNFYNQYTPKMITAPVLFYSGKSIWSKFLELDLISLMGITAASIENKTPNMVNGANLFFTKKVFNAVNGFEGNENIASGDDIFLMQKINKKYPNSIQFLKNKNAIAFTNKPKHFLEFVNQRIRWTSKSSRHADKKVKQDLVLFYLFYLLIFINVLFLFFFSVKLFFIGFLMLIFKTLYDYIFFNKLLVFFNKEKLKKYFIVIEVLHIPYITCLGILSLMGKYKWKGRKVNY